MKTQLTLLHPIPAKKNNYRVSKTGQMYKPNQIKEFEALVWQETKAQKCLQIPGTFSLKGKFYLSKAQDLDNAVTTLLDALQQAGVIENDKLNVHLDIWKITVGKIKGCEVTIAAV